MKNLFALLGLTITVLAVVGWHQDWYRLSVHKNTDGTLRVQTDVNTSRASQDLHFWGQNLGEWIKNKPSGPAAGTPGPELSSSPQNAGSVIPGGSSSQAVPGQSALPADGTNPAGRAVPGVPTANDHAARPSNLQEGAGWLMNLVLRSRLEK